MPTWVCLECGDSFPTATVCCGVGADLCPRCDGEGHIEQCRADGSDCWYVPCDCPAGVTWAINAREAARRASDPHERAAARARANDFEDTDGRDWT